MLLASSGVAAADAMTTASEPTCAADADWPDQHAMRFTFQQANGHHVLVGEGTIDADLVPRLQAALDSGPAIDELWLRSTGGDSGVAREAAMLIRGWGLPTRVPAGWVCAEACTFMFMGGIMRAVDPGAYFIIRRGTEASEAESAMAAGGAERARIAQTTAVNRSEEHRFLIRVGVSQGWLTDAIGGPATASGSTAQYCLSPEALDRYNVTTRVFFVPEQASDPEKK